MTLQSGVASLKSRITAALRHHKVSLLRNNGLVGDPSLNIIGKFGNFFDVKKPYYFLKNLCVVEKDCVLSDFFELKLIN